MSKFVFDVIAKNEKRPHIANQVHPATMQEHTTEERKYLIRTKLLEKIFRHEPEIFKKSAQVLVAKRNFKEKQQHVDRDDQVGDERNCARGLGVSERKHCRRNWAKLFIQRLQH